MIYFIGNTKEGVVKIGRTESDIKKRLSSIQNTCHYKLFVFMTINHENPHFEKVLHYELIHYRLRGEWYKYVPDILDTVLQKHGFSWNHDNVMKIENVKESVIVKDKTKEIKNDKITIDTESVRVSREKLDKLRSYADMGGLRQLMDEAIDEKLVKLKKMREFKEGLKDG